MVTYGSGLYGAGLYEGEEETEAAAISLSVKVDWNQDGDFTDANEDVTSLVRRNAGLSFEYGRDQSTALAPTVAGRGGLTLDNVARRFSPRNTGSPIYPNVKPARPVKVHPHHSGHRICVVQRPH